MVDNGDSSEALEVLLASGTVRGTCLLKNGEVIYEKFPYSAARLVKVCRVVEGLTKEFKAQGRSVDQMAFGYDGGNLLAVTVDNYRVIFIHLMSDEIDFLAKAARVLLTDLIAADKPARDAVSLDTVPISLVKNNLGSDARVEDTARVEILTTPPPEEIPAAGGLSPENMSVEDLVGYYSSQDTEK